MKYKVVKGRLSGYPNPIEIRTNEVVSVGQEYTGKETWKNWVRCTNTENCSSWVPKQILKLEKGGAVVLEDYSANELTIETGEEIEILKIVNGWAWSKNKDNELGWIPLENIGAIEL